MASTGRRCCPDHPVYGVGVPAGPLRQIRLGRRLVDDGHLPVAARFFGLAADLVPAHRAATVLSAHRHDVLDGLSSLGFLDTAVSRGECPAARLGRVALLAIVAAAPGAGRLAGRRHLRAAPRDGRVGRLDHRTKKRALAGLYLGALLAYLRFARGVRVAGSGDKQSGAARQQLPVPCHWSRVLFYGLALFCLWRHCWPRPRPFRCRRSFC